MANITIHESAVIDAPPTVVYGIVADYNEKHPVILPKPEFESIKVTKGGIGTGTEFDMTMIVMGQTTHSHVHVTEPEPGRVLVEADPKSGTVTTFTVEPVAGTEKTQLTFDTEMRASAGIKGLVERLLVPRVLRGLYKREFTNIQQYVKDNVLATA
ncbi:MAG: hypothetical protein CL607_08765 [Anaerolineaceae bacterium]|nr:hypothetical protein [Anaerolineaceae bacterium]